MTSDLGRWQQIHCERDGVVERRLARSTSNCTSSLSAARRHHRRARVAATDPQRCRHPRLHRWQRPAGRGGHHPIGRGGDEAVQM